MDGYTYCGWMWLTYSAMVMSLFKLEPCMPVSMFSIIIFTLEPTDNWQTDTWDKRAHKKLEFLAGASAKGMGGGVDPLSDKKGKFFSLNKLEKVYNVLKGKNIQKYAVFARYLSQCLQIGSNYFKNIITLNLSIFP